MKTIEINASWGCAPTIDLGQRGENLATEVRFDFAGWAEEFGAPGAVELYVRRAGETTPYPVALTIEDTVAVWPVSAIDTHIIGLGEAELVYLIDGAVVKTAVYGTAVEPDIGQPDGTPPDPYETWMEELGEMAAGTLINAQRAETAQDGAEAAQTAAEAAQSEAETAQESAEAAQTGAETAQTAAEAAQTAAESAQTGAQDAESRTERYRADAEGFAVQSMDNASAAAASATTAQTAATTATQKATAAATSASTATQKATDASRSANAAQAWAGDAGESAITAVTASDNAQTYASNASASATAAAGSATAAANSATAAAASASAAAASETAAGSSATAAAASETAAEVAQAAAEAVLESIPPDYSALSDEVDDLRDALVTPTETGTTASRDYAVGDYFWHDGNLYRARYNIETGDTIDYGTNAEICGAADEIARLYKTEDTAVNALHNLVYYWYDNPVDKTSDTTFVGKIVRNGTRILLNGSCPANATTAKIVVTVPGTVILVGSPATVVKKFPIPMIDGHTYRARLHVISGTATQRVYPLFHKTTAINAVGSDSVDLLTGDEIRDLTFNSADYPDGIALSVSILRRTDGNVLTNFLFDLTVEDITDGATGQEFTNIAPAELEIATATHAVGDLLVYNHQLYKVTAAIAVGETLVPGTNIVATTVGSKLTTVAATVDDIVSSFVVSPSAYATKQMYLQNGTMSTSSRAVEIKNGVITYKSFSTYNRGFAIADAIYPISGQLASHVFTLDEIAPINRLANANMLTTFNNYSSDSSAAYYVLRVYFFAVDENDTVTKVGDFTAPLGNGLHKTQFTVPEGATHYTLVAFTSDNSSFNVTIVPEFSIT